MGLVNPLLNLEVEYGMWSCLGCTQFINLHFYFDTFDLLVFLLSFYIRPGNLRVRTVTLNGVTNY